MIVILFTGGTIAMRTDASGAVPSLNAKDILEATKGILSGSAHDGRKNVGAAQSYS